VRDLFGPDSWVTQDLVNRNGQLAGYGWSGDRYHAYLFEGDSKTEIMPLPGQFVRESVPRRLNDAGEVVGEMSNQFGWFASFYWSKEVGTVQIGAEYQDIAAYKDVYAADINDRGEVVGQAGIQGGFYWTLTTGFKPLPNFWAYRINNAGVMIGNTPTSAGTATSDGTFTPFPFVTCCVSGGRINDAGLISGSARLITESAGEQAFLWDGSTLENISDQLQVQVGGFSYPMYLNQSGQVVGYAHQPNSEGDPLFGFFKDVGANAVPILSLVSGPFTNTIPYAINNHGLTVGLIEDRNASAVAHPLRAFAWTKSQGMIDLNTRLSNAPTGLEPWIATAVLDDGSIVAYSNTGFVLLTPTVPTPLPAPPVLGPIAAVSVVPVNGPLAVSVPFTDINVADTHAVMWMWGDGASSIGGVTESGGVGTGSGSHAFAAAGIYTLVAQVTDNTGRLSTGSRDVVVYDPSAGFVSGGGWIDSPAGAYRVEPALAGRASFGFVSKYARGATVPSGETEFRFSAAKLNFESDSYEWLVVGGARAQFKGAGTINGASGFKFLLTAIDGELLAGVKGSDRFRIKIWHNDGNGSDVVDYDNQMEVALDGGDGEGSKIIGGSIVIHK
jgi:hypothetical protein